MSAADPDNSRVVFTVKEILSEMNGKLDGVLAAVALKADEAALNDVRRELARIEIEMATLRGRDRIVGLAAAAIIAFVSAYLGSNL